MKKAFFFAFVTEVVGCFPSSKNDELQETDKPRPQLIPATRAPVLVNPRPRTTPKKKQAKSKPDYDPKEVERIRVFSTEPSSRCEAPGAEGKPCSYTMNIGQDCEEKQWWSDNGWTIYRSKEGFQVNFNGFREKLIFEPEKVHTLAERPAILSARNADSNLLLWQMSCWRRIWIKNSPSIYVL